MHRRSTRRIARRRLTWAVLESLETRSLLSQTIYVDANPSITTHSGTAWNSAYADLQSALSAAVSGDQIRVADGTYKPTSGTDRTVSFQLKTGVSILGGYAGFGAADPDARDVVANPTILSGDLGVVGTNTDNSFHVVVGSGANSTAILDGFTITAGRANGPSIAQFGGGMYNSGGSPTVSDCSFIGNIASSRGGGIYNTSSSSPVLINCIFCGNTASSNGGGMYNLSSSPTLTNCTFSSNIASNGAGIYNSSAFPTLTNCIVWGGGSSPIFDSSGTSTVTYSDIQGGFAGVGNLNGDPQFVRIRWAGPDGVFGTADDDSGDYHLRSGSPALNAGSNSAVPVGTSTDLVGSARIQDGTVDLGAYEGSFSVPAAKLIYVDLNAPGANNGTSWANAFTSLSSAILAANGGDSVWIADGTYKPTTGTDRTISFGLKSGISLHGGYAGYGGTDPDARDIAAFPTILSGNIGITSDNTDNSYHVVTAVDINGTTVDGVTITLGCANGASQQFGAGLFASTSTLTLSNCNVSQNTAGGGGGIYNDRSSPNLVNVVVAGNTAASGGGMYNSSAKPTLTNCNFNDNDSGASGGGMFNSSSSLPTLINCSFSGNGKSAQSGAGMYNSSSSPILTNCTFSRNGSYENNQFGGGVYNVSSSPMLTNCIFSGNISNESNGEGGGIYNSSSSPQLTNCIFSGNTAYYGGGMYNDGSSPILANSNFVANTASLGGGICNISASLMLTNCIVWCDGSLPISGDSNTLSISYCDVQGDYAGVSNLDIDPQFIRSPWAGPDGAFGTADDDYGDLRLRAGSAALNVGSNAAIPLGIFTDLAGSARIQNGTIDLGAYEGAFIATAPKMIYVDSNAVGAGNGTSWTDAFTGLSSAILVANDGDTIRIADGTYKPTTGTDRTLGFALKNGLSLYGGYAGYGASNPDERDVVSFPTILSGDIGVAGTNTDNSFHVMTAVGIGSATAVDGVAITLGTANGSATDQSFGGGLFNQASSPTINNCVFSRNYSGGGGGIYNSSSSPTLTNCSFTGNTASDDSGGGGMANSSSSPTLINCIFAGNTAVAGGAMCDSGYSCAPTLINCTFDGNANGAIEHNGSVLSMTNCIVWGSGSSAINSSIYAPPPSISCCDIEGGVPDAGNINTDPGFVRSAWTGPDGVYGTADDDYGDLRLRIGSPALNTGSNAAFPAGITTDFAGNPRIQDSTVDMGAYEGVVAVTPKLIYVDGDAVGAGDGTDWANAFTYLSSAIQAATDGDTIRVADGTYKPTTSTDRTVSFVLKSDVSLYGGYAGYGAGNPNARNIIGFQTVFSGDIGVPGTIADNSYHVVSAVETDGATVDGITITQGNANGDGTDQDTGAGLYLWTSSSTFINCTFKGNSASYSGGGMYNYSSSPTLTDCTFIGNPASIWGGGLYNYSSSPTLTNCSFSGNSADAGGGMYNYYSGSPYSGSGYLGSDPTLTNCVFMGNTAIGAAGIENTYSSMMLTNCIVWGAVSNIILDNGNGTLTISYSDIQGGWSGTGNINADPLFVDADGADNISGTADDNLRLQANSPCLDAGSNAAVPGAITSDLAARGKSRFSLLTCGLNRAELCGIITEDVADGTGQTQDGRSTAVHLHHRSAGDQGQPVL